MLDSFKRQQNLQPYFDNAYGFAIFDTITKAGFGIGSAAGKGKVFVNNKDGTETHVGNSSVFQVSVGWQFGGEFFSEMIFFETERDFQNFTTGSSFEFGADANVVALTASASAKATTLGNQGLQAGATPDGITVDNLPKNKGECNYTKGMAVFTIIKSGLMYEFTVSGQKFDYKPIAATDANTAGATPCE